MPGALLIAHKEGDQLIERGKVGSGIGEKTLVDLPDSLRVLRENNGIAWVHPSLQVELNYFEEAKGGHFRFLVFIRIVAYRIEEITPILKITLIVFLFGCRNTLKMGRKTMDYILRHVDIELRSKVKAKATLA